MKKIKVIRGVDQEKIAFNLTGKSIVARINAENINGSLFQKLYWPNISLYHPSPKNFIIIIDQLSDKEKIQQIAGLSKIRYRPKYSNYIIEIDRPEIIITTP